VKLLNIDLWHKKVGCSTPKGQSPFSGAILKFGQAILVEIFVQKISNF
jgi:hypothetical protein